MMHAGSFAPFTQVFAKFIKLEVWVRPLKANAGGLNGRFPDWAIAVVTPRNRHVMRDGSDLDAGCLSSQPQLKKSVCDQALGQMSGLRLPAA